MLKKGVLALVGATFAAHAQVAPVAPVDPVTRPVDIRTGITMEVTASDNFNLAPDANKEDGQAIEISPYLSATVRTEKSRGDLALRLRGLWYTSGGTDDTRLSPDLRANGDLSINGDSLRLAGSAYVFKTSPSPFGIYSLDAAGSGVDSELYKAVGISPYSIGRVGSADYELRYKAQMIDPGNTPRSTEQQIAAGLSSSRVSAARLGWSVHGDTSRVDFENNFDFTQTSAEALGYLGITPLLRVGAGVNYSRVSILFDEDGDNSGVGPVGFFSWQPGPRTSLVGKYTDAYYGSATLVSFAHRGPRWLTGLQYNRGLNNGNQSGLLYFDPNEIFALPGTTAGATDQLIQGMTDRRLVSGAGRALILGQTGAELTYSESLIASFGIVRPRNSALVTVFSNKQKPAIAGIAGLDGSTLEQVGVNLALNHRLNSTDSLFLLGQAQQSKSTASGQESRLDLLVGGWNSTLTRQLTFTLALRGSRQRSTGATLAAEYKERAVLAALDYRF